MPDLVARLTRLERGDRVPEVEIAAFAAEVDRAERDLTEAVATLADLPWRFMPAAQ
jgi:hypothetical protein